MKNREHRDPEKEELRSEKGKERSGKRKNWREGERGDNRNMNTTA